jgi:hypothetical protein
MPLVSTTKSKSRHCSQFFKPKSIGSTSAKQNMVFIKKITLALLAFAVVPVAAAGKLLRVSYRISQVTVLLRVHALLNLHSKLAIDHFSRLAN